MLSSILGKKYAELEEEEDKIPCKRSEKSNYTLTQREKLEMKAINESKA